MLLAVDIGNTNTVLGLFDGDRIAGRWRLSSERTRTTDEMTVLVSGLLGEHRARATAAVVGSVVPQLTDTVVKALRGLLGVEPFVVDVGALAGEHLGYENPRELGPDRLANALAARELYGTPAVVIDFGTATTFEVVDEAGGFVGGAILPGMRVALEGLYRQAAMLYSIDLHRPAHAIGRNTADCIRSGAYHGTIGSIREILDQIGKELGRKPKVIATGGLYHILEGSPLFDIEDPDLTLKGLRLLALRQPPR